MRTAWRYRPHTRFQIVGLITLSLTSRMKLDVLTQGTCNTGGGILRAGTCRGDWARRCKDFCTQPGPKDAAQARRETIHRQREELRQQRECISDLRGQLSDLRQQHKVALELRELQHKKEKQEEVGSIRAQLLDDVPKLQAKVEEQNVILESIKQPWIELQLVCT